MNGIEELSSRLRESGLRVTEQRRCIIEMLQDDSSHPTVEALFERAQAAMPSISLKTVYQTVYELEALGEVRVLDVGTGSLRVDPNVEHDHQHLVCSECGRVTDVTVDLSSVHLDPSSHRGFDIDRVDVAFRGVCRNC